MKTRAGVVIPAAGVGRRMGGAGKALLELAGRPLLAHALQPFLDDERVVAIRVAMDPLIAAAPPGWLTEMDDRIAVVAGGSERGESVSLAVDALPADIDVIVVHDAARPLVSSTLVALCIDEAARGRSVVVGVPLTDTVHETSDDGRIVRTPARDRLWQAQTPQAFPAAVLRDSYRQAAQADVVETDDAALVARFAGPVHVIEGERSNIKITVSSDMVVAEALLKQRA